MKSTASNHAERLEINKPRGKLHPIEVHDTYPKHRFWPNAPGDKSHYGHLTDEAPYREYAWEFLRRNRFFQQEQDEFQPKYREERWAFQYDPEMPGSNGLQKQTPYRQSYMSADTGNVQWAVINAFRSQFASKGMPRQRGGIVQLEVYSDQVAIVFDITPCLGGTEAIDLQIELAREKLWQLAHAAKYAATVKPKINHPTKHKLRNLLRIIDLFSARDHRPLKMIAEMFTGFEHPSSEQNDDSPAENNSRQSRITELSKEAFRYVYEGEYLTLLPFDPWPWAESQPITPSSQLGQKVTAVPPRPKVSKSSTKQIAPRRKKTT